MSRRIVLGPRNNGDVGLFISPPGVDAFTAADSALTLNVTSKVSQLLLLGRVGVGTFGVTLGVSRSPYVMITSQWDFSGVSGHSTGPGPYRPSPPSSGYTPSTCTINSNGASMTIVSPYGVVYSVYSQAFT